MLRFRISCLVLVFSLACGDDGGAFDAGLADGAGADGAGADGAGADGAVADGGEALDSGLDAAEDAGDPDAGVDSGPPGPPCAEALDLYADSSCETPRLGILSYSPRFWLWSDGTDKDRFIRFPEGSVIDTSDPNRWIFPVGTKIWKTFSLDGMRLETRVMEKTASGTGRDYWQFRTYRWSEDQRSVTEVVNGERDVLGTAHDIPAQAACIRCHGPVGGGSVDAVLGFGTIQLAHDDTETNLETLAELGFLSETVSRSAGAVPGNAATVAALGYMHANCGHCHGPSPIAPGSGLALWVLADEPLTRQPAYQTAVRVMAGWRDATAPDVALQRVDPGNPEGSAVYLRMGIRDGELTQMPPLATDVVHTEGREIIEAWILGGEFPE